MSHNLLLSLENVSIFNHYTNQYTLTKINLKIENGETIALVGPSGSGKTTLARLIKGYSNFTNGSIKYKGEIKTSQELLRDVSIQLIFQNPYESFTPHKSIISTLYEYLSKYQRVDISKQDGYIHEYCKSLNIHPCQLKALPSQLSGGELQRIALVRALLAQPKLLICDEILSSLDYFLREETLKLLLEYQKRANVSIIFITHDLTTIADHFNKLVILQGGEIIDSGNAKEMICLKRNNFIENSLEALNWLSK